MTPEKFRLWIVILLATMLVTVWLGMGLKLCKRSRHGKMWKKCAMMMEKKGMKCPMMEHYK
jgi:hypothetical protein